MAKSKDILRDKELCAQEVWEMLPYLPIKFKGGMVTLGSAKLSLEDLFTFVRDKDMVMKPLISYPNTEWGSLKESGKCFDGFFYTVIGMLSDFFTYSIFKFDWKGHASVGDFFDNLNELALYGGIDRPLGDEKMAILREYMDYNAVWAEDLSPNDFIVKNSMHEHLVSKACSFMYVLRQVCPDAVLSITTSFIPLGLIGLADYIPETWGKLVKCTTDEMHELLAEAYADDYEVLAKGLEGAFSSNYFGTEMPLLSGVHHFKNRHDGLEAMEKSILDFDSKPFKITCFKERELEHRRSIRGNLANIRGVGFCFWWRFALAVYQEFGSVQACFQDMPFDKYFKILNDGVSEVLERSLGNDHVADYIRTGKKFEGEDHVYFETNDYGASVTEDSLFHGLYARQYCGAPLMKEDGKPLTLSGETFDGLDLEGYFDPRYVVIWASSIYVKQYKEPNKGVSSREADTLKEQVRSLTVENGRLSEKIDDLSREMGKNLSEVQQTLDVERNKYANLLARYESLYDDYVQAFGSDFEEPDEDEEAEISEPNIEEYVEALKTVHLVMVGGRFELQRKLEALGLDQIYYCNNTSDLDGSMPLADFVVVNTRFCSHNLNEKARSQFPLERDQFIYYNGTNVERLLKTIYDFVEAWLAK